MEVESESGLGNGLPCPCEIGTEVAAQEGAHLFGEALLDRVDGRACGRVAR